MVRYNLLSVTVPRGVPSDSERCFKHLPISGDLDKVTASSSIGNAAVSEAARGLK